MCLACLSQATFAKGMQAYIRSKVLWFSDSTSDTIQIQNTNDN